MLASSTSRYTLAPCFSRRLTADFAGATSDIWWDKNKIPYQVLNPDDVRKAFPVISMDDITAVLYEPDAGVVRALIGWSGERSGERHREVAVSSARRSVS